MTGQINVNKIGARGDGTTALTINSNGTMTPSKMIYASFRTSSNTTFSAGQGLITNWEAMPSPATTLGASMTHNSGIFTFPHTGKFLIKAVFGQNASGGNRAYAGGSIQYSSDSGGNYNKITRTLGSIYTDGGWTSAFCELLIEITNISTERIAFHVYVNGNTVLSNSDNGTMCIFQQVG